MADTKTANNSLNTQRQILDIQERALAGLSADEKAALASIRDKVVSRLSPEELKITDNCGCCIW